MPVLLTTFKIKIKNNNIMQKYIHRWLCTFFIYETITLLLFKDRLNALKILCDWIYLICVSKMKKDWKCTKTERILVGDKSYIVKYIKVHH